MEFAMVRAWKDARYRQTQTAEQQAVLPVNPAGTCELADAELECVQGSIGGAFGSATLENCIVSLGATGKDSCNTFGQFVGQCINREY